MRKTLLSLLLAPLLLTGGNPEGSEPMGPVAAPLSESFSAVGAGPPAGWKPIVFGDIPHTGYAVVESERGPALEGRAEQSASGLVWDRPFDPHLLPALSWTWKISGILPKGDITRKTGDDVPARLLVMFPFVSDQAGPWERTVFGMYKLVHGEYPPARALTYLWANRAPVGTIVDSAYTLRSKLLVLESGNARAGQWHSQRRDIAQDFQRAFPGEPLPRRARLGIMVDADNTGGQATAWFDDVSVSPRH